MKTVIAALLLALSTSVLATNDNHGSNSSKHAQRQRQTQNMSVDVSNRISNQSRANALAYSGSTSQSNNSQSLNVTPAPVTATLIVNEAKIPENTRNEQVGTVNVRSVPNVYGGNVYPTAPCMGSSAVGGSWLGGGGTVGTSWTDDECSIRETARSFQNLNMNTDAVSVLCSSKYAAAAPACKNMK